LAYRIGAPPLIAILLVLSLGPIVWLAYSSFKSLGSIIAQPFSLPKQLLFSNYSSAWTEGNLGRDLVNSVVVSALSLAIMMICGSLAGYAITRYTTVRIRFGVLFFLLVGQMIPGQVIVIPLFLIIKELHLLNTYVGLALVYAALGTPFVTFLMQAYFAAVPRELFDAAAIDGHGELSTFARIALPIARPAIAATLIIQFLFVWNEFLLASVIDGTGNNVTLPVGLYNAVQGPYATAYGIAFAGAIIALIPMVIVYALLQKHIVRGIALGAVKG
jgi:multiple sugar transport system permease protein/raffinose/stachyose/melibiose transport system permease protein/N-acetylglucosamine transport system permease protein